jgi:hypothetical protein
MEKDPLVVQDARLTSWMKGQLQAALGAALSDDNVQKGALSKNTRDLQDWLGDWGVDAKEAYKIAKECEEKKRQVYEANVRKKEIQTKKEKEKELKMDANFPTMDGRQGGSNPNIIIGDKSRN